MEAEHIRSQMLGIAGWFRSLSAGIAVVLLIAAALGNFEGLGLDDRKVSGMLALMIGAGIASLKLVSWAYKSPSTRGH